MPTRTGTVYLLHFDRPYRHARHYLGWAEDLDNRLAEHAAAVPRCWHRLDPRPPLDRHPHPRTPIEASRRRPPLPPLRPTPPHVLTNRPAPPPERNPRAAREPPRRTRPRLLPARRPTRRDPPAVRHRSHPRRRESSPPALLPDPAHPENPRQRLVDRRARPRHRTPLRLRPHSRPRRRRGMGATSTSPNSKPSTSPAASPPPTTAPAGSGCSLTFSPNATRPGPRAPPTEPTSPAPEPSGEPLRPHRARASRGPPWQ
jgi:hypothetical protein